MFHKKREGGVSIHVKEVSRELKKMGFRVDEITRNEDLRLTSFFTSYHRMKLLFKKLSRKYDVIHCHDWSIAYPALKASIKNLVATFHAFPTNPVAKIFEDYCINQLSFRAIVISPRMKRIYNNATLIPNGVNLSIFRKLESIRRVKNLVGLAQKYNLRKIISVLKKKHFDFVFTDNKLKYEDLGKFYSRIEIFISVPYEAAGFNMVWLEAMACEVPYIIGTKAGIGEMLPIIKISGIRELPDLLNRIREGKITPLKDQRKWILMNNLTWKNHAKKLVKLYEEI